METETIAGSIQRGWVITCAACKKKTLLLVMPDNNFPGRLRGAELEAARMRWRQNIDHCWYCSACYKQSEGATQHATIQGPEGKLQGNS